MTHEISEARKKKNERLETAAAAFGVPDMVARFSRVLSRGAL